MALFMIGYDLVKKGEHDYTNLIEAIKALGPAWWRHLDSTWLVESDRTAEQIGDSLWAHMHADDRLLVATISAPAAWVGFKEAGAEWLRTKL